MNAQTNDIYSTWSDGFANAVRDVCLPSGQDAYEIVVAAFGHPLTLEDFHALDDADFARLSEVANKCLETQGVGLGHVREAVAYLRQHWPLANHQD